jgi:mRNA interferase MazF
MTPARWSVWLANLDPGVGSEQGKPRPVLVISDTRLNQILPVVNVLPLPHASRSDASTRTKHCCLPGQPDFPPAQSSSAIKSARSISNG